MRRVPSLLLTIALIAGIPALAADGPPSALADFGDVNLSQSLRQAPGKGHPLQYSLKFPETWTEAPQVFYNSRKLINVPVGREGELAATARIKIYVEPRLDHADALRQLSEFAAGIGAKPDEFLEIGGWPALQTTYVAKRPRPDREENFAEDLEVLRVSTLVAAGDALVTIDAALPSEAKGRLVREAQAIARSLALETTGDEQSIGSELDALRQGLSDRASAATKGGSEAAYDRFVNSIRSTAPTTETRQLVDPDDPGFNQRVYFSGFGEVEIAVSPDGQQVVIGRQGNWETSNDGGETFPFQGTVNAFDGGDPSVAWGQSGTFYYAGIDRNCQNTAYLNPPAGGAFGVDCTGFTRSFDGGQTFPLANPAVVCPRDDPNNPGTVANRCFPDQEHIAADRVNAGGGGDQVYSTWRNFDAADQDAGLVCSQDSAVNWTAPFDLGPGSFFPRIATGSDGFVYVAAIGNGGNYRLWKFNSCANGLGVVPGFPVNVAPLPGDPCPFAGHDRCDQNPESQTVIVDDVNPNHLYFAYTRTTGATNDDILVHHSVDGGATWSAPVQANAAVPGERIMPWLCATGGDAFVTWFDRRNAPVCLTPPCPGINNDRTDFYGAQVGVDFGGSLQALGDFVISEGPDNWCDSGWPCGTRYTPSASESCSLQPQLAGTCVESQGTAGTGDDVSQGIRCDFSDCGGPDANINFGANPNCQCTNASATIWCASGGGCPKYGDYNGNACVAGRLYAAWPSRISPPGVPPPTNQIGILFDSMLVGEVPHLQVPGSLTFPGTCGGGSSEATLEVCNTGTVNLEISSITSDDTQFEVTHPSGGYPVRISPDFCFPFEVVFTPGAGATGTETATLTIFSDDPTSPQTEVEASAAFGEPAIVTTFLPGGSFGDVCLGSTSTETLTIQNSGGCDLVVSAISVTTNPTEFSLGAIDTLPIAIASGDSVAVPVRFSPSGDIGAANGQITITSNDPDNAGAHTVNLSGNSPAATLDLFVADSGNFGNVCSGDFKDLNVTVQNNGACPLELTALSLPVNDQGDFELPSGNAADSQLEPNNSLQLPIRFAPDSFVPAGTRNGTLQADGRTLFATSALQQTRALSGVAPPPDINVPANGPDPIDVDFGNVCAGVTSDISIPVCNTGLCTLNVTNAYLEALGGGGNCEDFTIVQNPFPDLVSHDFCMDVVVRFTPTTAEGTQSCQLVIESDDPDESPIVIGIQGTTPTTVIDIPGDMLFPPEVVQQVDNCSTLQPFPIGNNGLCPLQITGMTIDTNPLEYGIDGLPSTPTFLQPGHVFGAGDLDIEFHPHEPIDRFKQGVVEVSYVSDSVLGTITDVPVDLCGDGFYTGARVLVTYNGTPVDTVERIQIQRITANRNRRPRLDTVSVLRNVPLVDVTAPADTACQDYQFHSEYGTPWNPNQLLPGVYQINATIRVDGRRYTKSVGYSLDSCDFNPQVIVSFP